MSVMAGVRRTSLTRRLCGVGPIKTWAKKSAKIHPSVIIRRTGWIIGMLNGAVAALEHRTIRIAHEMPLLWVNLLRFFSAALLLFLLAWWWDVLRLPSGKEWFFVATPLAFETVVMHSYVKAFRLSDQSLVGPLCGVCGDIVIF